MRLAVFSDLHGNAYAFERLIAELRREQFDAQVCLGDAIQGGPQPAETLALLNGLGCPVVLGNADQWLLDGIETGKDPIPEARLRKLQAVREWSLSRLSAADKAVIASFQRTVRLPLDSGRDLLCFHGSPASFDDIILPTTPEDEFNGYLAAYLPAIMCGGHTHMPQLRRIGASDSFFFNPGSVGLAYSHNQPADDFHADAWVEYAVLTAERGRVALEFRRIEYDAKPYIAVLKASGKPFTAEAVAQYTK